MTPVDMVSTLLYLTREYLSCDARANQINWPFALDKLLRMKRTLPPLNALRAFEAAGRLGSFKEAAAELHVTHGAVSQHVRALEEWLGASLFERHNRRVALTPAAKAYLAEIGPLFEQLSQATARYGFPETV